jgi:hypothetical protein
MANGGWRMAEVEPRSYRALLFLALALVAVQAAAQAYPSRPVRVLVVQEADGSGWVAWTDFAWIARRHHIADRQQQFAMATSVVESITSTVRAR